MLLWQYYVQDHRLVQNKGLLSAISSSTSVKILCKYCLQSVFQPLVLLTFSPILLYKCRIDTRIWSVACVMYIKDSCICYACLISLYDFIMVFTFVLQTPTCSSIWWHDVLQCAAMLAKTFIVIFVPSLFHA